MEQENQQKQAAANYVLNFYTDIANLTHYYANYENLLLEFMKKYGKNNFDKAEESEKTILKELCHTIRYYVMQSNIKYRSIMLKSGQGIDNNVQEKYKIIMQQFVIDKEVLQDYVLNMNSVLMDTVIKSLLESSTDILNKLYSQEDKS